MQERFSTPFTMPYPEVLDDLILSYLPPYDLKRLGNQKKLKNHLQKSLAADKVLDFEIIFFLHKLAAEKFKQSFALLTQNLLDLTLEQSTKIQCEHLDLFFKSEEEWIDKHKKHIEFVRRFSKRSEMPKNPEQKSVNVVIDEKENEEEYEISFEEYKYNELLRQNQLFLYQIIKTFMDHPEKIAEEFDLLLNVLIHYTSINNYYQAPSLPALLDGLFTLKDPNVQRLITFLLDNDTPVIRHYVEHEDRSITYSFTSGEYSMLYTALISQVPAYQVKKIIEKTKEQEQQIEYRLPGDYLLHYLCGSSLDAFRYKHIFRTTPLLIALCTYPTDNHEIFKLLIEQFPAHVDITIESLNWIEALPNPSCAAFPQVNIEAKQVPQLKNKLSQILLSNEFKPENLPLSKPNLLTMLEASIKSCTSLKEIFDIYENHINSTSINLKNHPYADFFICTLTRNNDRYTRTKKKFIELMREKVYSILHSNVLIETLKMHEYLKICEETLKHPIFADSHDQQWVDATWKKKLAGEVAQMQSQLSTSFRAV